VNGLELMMYWRLFWTAAVLSAGLIFAVVTVIVSIRGLKDLVSMFLRLAEQKGTVRRTGAPAPTRADGPE